MIARVLVTAVIWHEDATRTVEYRCICHLTHRVAWPVGHLQIGKREASCGATVDIEIPEWAYGTRSYRSTRSIVEEA